MDTFLRLAETFVIRRLDNMQPATLADFLDDLAVLIDVDLDAATPSAMRAMTIHSAKGLEARVVVVIGCNEGIFPSLPVAPRHGVAAEPDPEEVRLFYVALTRAREHVILTTTRGRTWRGHRPTPPSRYLSWLPDWCHVIKQL